MKKISIAIDGPAGAGKTTVAKGLAEKLGYKYVDTGAMYRAIAWKSIQLKINIDDEESIIGMTSKTAIDFLEGDGSKIIVDGKDISIEIRNGNVTQLSSPVSAISGVRKILVAKQRQLAGDGGVVMEGRDIGTVVLPKAEVKIFLIASISERAKRRYNEIVSSGSDADLDVIKKSIEERDHRDSNRIDSPLKRADGAIDIDTDFITAEQVIEKIYIICQNALNQVL